MYNLDKMLPAYDYTLKNSVISTDYVNPEELYNIRLKATRKKPSTIYIKDSGAHTRKPRSRMMQPDLRYKRYHRAHGIG